MTKHRAHVVQAARAVIQQIVLHHCAHHTCRRLWAQCQGLAVQAVFEGVHLLFDDIGDLAKPTDKQPGWLHNGCSYIAIRVRCHQVPQLGLQPFPMRGLRGENIVHAFNGN